MRQRVKVKEVNLERENPTVSQAITQLVNELSTAKRIGIRAVILIHGYGSSGVGGAIKPAVKSKLGERSLSGMIKTYVEGENWETRKKFFLGECGQLKDYDRYISGNRGITVVLLK